MSGGFRAIPTAPNRPRAAPIGRFVRVRPEGRAPEVRRQQRREIDIGRRIEKEPAFADRTPPLKDSVSQSLPAGTNWATERSAAVPKFARGEATGLIAGTVSEREAGRSAASSGSRHPSRTQGDQLTRPRVRRVGRLGRTRIESRGLVAARDNETDANDLAADPETDPRNRP